MTPSPVDARHSSRWLVTLLLLFILLAGFALRVFHVDYADGQLPHPDERSTVAFYAPTIRWPAEGISPLDKRQSPLNPLWSVERQERRSYTYGHFPLYLLVLTANAAHELAPVAERLGASPELVQRLRTANGVPGFAVVGRVIMAVADTATVLLIFLLADRIYGRRRGRWWPGLLAAAFSAFTVLQIQLSHFFAVDPISTTFTVLALYGALRMVEAGRGSGKEGKEGKKGNGGKEGKEGTGGRGGAGAAWAVVCGIGAGLAIASKFSALPILAAPVVAGFLIWWRARRAEPEVDEERAGLGAALLWPLLALGVAVLTFVVTSPFAILDWANFRQAVLVEQGAMVQGKADFPFTRQYRGTLPYLYFIEQQIRWGIGWPLGILAFAGLAWALLKLLIGRGEDGEIVILSWIVPYFGLTGLFLAKFMRYMVPVTPLLMVFAAGLVAAIWYGEVLGRRERRQRKETRESRETKETREMRESGEREGMKGAEEGELALLTVDDSAPSSASVPEPEALSPAGEPEPTSPPADYQPPLTADRSPATVHRSPATVHRSPVTGHRSPVTVHRSPATLRRALAFAIAAIALLGALFWSLAYVNGVYNNTHPWIKASRWIYANVPDGSTIAWEQWDDSLPYDLPEPNSNRGRYRFIDWGPFEEDRAEKFEWLKSTLRTADYLVLSSNRIYGAVDNLPERYPLTNRYYELLFDGQLGYELALKEENRPNLFGIVVDDEHADESFTLYDHPTVHVFRKVRDLSDAEWDALLGGSWEGAQAWYVGEPLLISRIFALFGDEQGQPAPREPGPGEGRSLLLDRPLDELPVVQDFRWNGLASRSPLLAALGWWLAISVIGLAAWPISFALFTNLRDRGFLLARSLGWLIMGWVVWMAASLRIGRNALPFIVAALLGMAAVSILLWRRNRDEMGAFVRVHKRILLFGEALFALAYAFFVLIRLFNPDIWQPWNGGEKFMEFAFLNAILRSAYMPPIDPYFAGGTINYYYYGHYLVNLLVKLTGIWSSVAFNLAIPTVFALTVANVFSLGYNLAGRMKRAPGGAERPHAGPGPEAAPAAPLQAGASSARLEEPDLPRSAEITDDQPPITDHRSPFTDPGSPFTDPGSPITDHRSPFTDHRLLRPRWLWHGVSGALLAVFFVALLGNVDGGGQVLRSLAQQSPSSFSSNLPGVQTAVRALSGFWHVATTAATLPGYRYWDPSRVIPYTINEFPYWSFLFADLHPHMIAIPFTVLFLALAYNLLAGYGQGTALPASRASRRQQVSYWLRRLTGNGLYVAMALNLGALAVINTWDLPTYFGLAVLAWLVREWRSGQFSAAPGRALLRTLLFAGGLGVLSIALYLPFFQHYQPLASSGVGIVKTKTELGLWLNMWGFLFFAALTFVLVELRRRPPSRWPEDPAIVRWLRLALDHFARLGRALALSKAGSVRLGSVATTALLLLAVGLLATAALWLLGFKVPALLVLPLAAAGLLLLRRSATPENLFIAILTFTGLLVLLGVEFVYLKDHLQGGDWRRMNTLFKFYIQVWVMLALAGGVALPRIWDFVQGRWRRGWRIAWSVAFGWLLLLSLAFPLFGTPARLDDRFPPENGRPPISTLDGMAYMEPGTYTWHPDPQQAPNTRIELRHDYDALRWLLDNVEGAPVVAEAVIGYYREGGLRVASFTGFPTLLGFHQEGEQRYGWQTGPRRGRAEEFWTTVDPQRAQQLINELDIDYIYVGQLERIVYSPEALAKFDQLVQQGVLEIVYRNDGVVIYRVL